MNSEIANLFVNKICTIFVNKINRNFDEEQNVNYFVGKILEINKDGILIEHIANKCKSFFLFAFDYRNSRRKFYCT